MRSLVLSLVTLSLLAAAPASAVGPTVLKAQGAIVALDEEWIAVKGAEDTLRCRIPDRLVDRVEHFALGDRVGIACSKRGKRSPELQLIVRAQKEKEKEHADRAQTIAGKVKAVSDDSITVIDGEHALKCDVPAAKAEALEGVEVGDRVKLYCKSGVLVQLTKVAEAPAVQAIDIAGRVTAASDAFITVTSTDKSRSLTCSVPDRLAEAVHALSVGDAVKLLCKRSGGVTELAAVTRVAAAVDKPKSEWSIAGEISSLSGDRVVVTGDGRSLSCSIPAEYREKLAQFAVGAHVKLLCRGTDERSAAVAALSRL